ncbi:MAG: hypothetical protein J1F11_00515 [Oscillospiraceae bacterium]|nr:hypothetical protein [Oscillospiraceae bacterium]
MNITGVFVIIPLAIIGWFAVSLELFHRCPDEETDRKKKLKIMLIISSVFVGLLFGFFILLFFAANIRT